MSMNFARFSAALVLLYSSLAVATPDEPSSTAFALRHYIRVLAPESMQPYAEAMVQAFMGRRQGQPPVIETRPARTAATLFCAGVGAAHPDVLVMPRRLSHAEYSRCTEQGVEQIAEVVFGYEVLALAVKREATPFPLTAEQLYRALAAEVPKDGQFQANTARTWHEVDGRLPEQEIRVVIPGKEAGARDLFNNEVLEAGCRGLAEIRKIYSATERTAKCLSLRRDGPLLEPPPYALQSHLLQAPAGTIGVLPLHQVEMAGRSLLTLPFEGVLPTRPSLETGSYPLSRKLYLYVKLGHIQERKGYGVTEGLREFLREASGEQALEPGGIFDRLGLILPPPAERVRQRLDGLLLRPMVR